MTRKGHRETGKEVERTDSGRVSGKDKDKEKEAEEEERRTVNKAGVETERRGELLF